MLPINKHGHQVYQIFLEKHTAEQLIETLKKRTLYNKVEPIKNVP